MARTNRYTVALFGADLRGDVASPRAGGAERIGEQLHGDGERHRRCTRGAKLAACTAESRELLAPETRLTTSVPPECERAPPPRAGRVG